MRSALRLLVLFAFLMRALVPAGFMSASVADGHGLTIVICTGSGELQSVTLDDEGQQVPSKSEGSSHEPCAFTGHVALVTPLFDITELLLVAANDTALIFATSVVLPPARAGPPLGSRAPPHHS